MSLAPTNEESAWMGKKTSAREKQPLFGSGMVCVDSFRLLTTSVRVSWKVETRFLFYSKNSMTRLMFNLSDLLLRSTLIVPFVLPDVIVQGSLSYRLSVLWRIPSFRTSTLPPTL